MASDRQPRIHVLPFSHLDLFWLGNRHECASRGRRIIGEAVRLCEEHEEFRFLIEDAVFLNRYVASSSDADAERLRSAMAAGRIEGPAKWAGIMATNVAGETLIRNTICGLRETERFCGRRPAALHLGDLPGLPAGLPQFTAGCGLPYVIFSRGGPSHTPLFRWESEDGSSVLAWYTPKCYNWGMRLALPPEDFSDADREKLMREAEAIAADTPGPVFMHAGWDLSVPTDHLVQNMERMKAAGADMRFSSQEEFFRAAEKADGIPSLGGELPTVWGNWPDPAYLDVTIHHGPAERALLWAERLSALTSVLRLGPHASLEAEWKALLESLDHNYSLIATEETHDEKVRLAESARTRADDVARASMQTIASEVEREPGRVPVLVFNPSLQPVSAIVRQRVLLYGGILANAEKGHNRFVLEDDAGECVPFQVLGHRHCGAEEYEMAFVARDVAPAGFTTWFVRAAEGDAESPSQPRDVDGPTTLDSDRMSLAVDPDSGVISLSLKDGGATLCDLLLRAVEQDPGNNVMQLRTVGEPVDFKVDSARIVNEGPIMTIVELCGSVGATPATVSVEMSPLCDHAVVRVVLLHDGGGFKRYQLVGTMPDGRAETGFIGTPFGANSLSNVLPGCGPRLGDEVLPETWPSIREAQGWFLVHSRVDVPENGLAVATDRKLIELSDDGFAINLLSSMSAKWIRGETVHHPFAGRYESSFTFRAVAADDVSVAEALGDTHFMGLRSFCDYSGSGEGQIPGDVSVLTCSSPGIAMTAFKPAQDGDGVVGRFREVSGEERTVKIGLAADTAGAWACDLLENDIGPVDPDAVHFRPHELKTIRWRLKG